MQHDNEIIVCTQHEKEVPLIFTFKFDGKEYWCPYCGYTSGILGAGRSVQIPDTNLLEEREKWLEKSRAYLSGETDEWIYENKG